MRLTISRPRFQRLILLLLIGLLPLACTGTTNSARFLERPGLARLEPEVGAYFGVNLDWGTESATAFADRLGLRPSVYVQFVSFPLGDEEKHILAQSFEQLAAEGGMAVVTLEPRIPLTEITPQMVDDVASFLKGYNDQGIGIFVRFAHEMNGSWYTWSQQPVAYIAAFRLLADAVHATAPGTAMLWAPTYAANYPFTGGPHEATPDDVGFDLLDTNADGILDGQDDPYAPYYPGDHAVDWVGLSLYHWGNTYPWGENEVPEAGKFVAHVTGTYNGLNGDERNVPDFYAAYVDGHGKPMAIVETAALYNPMLEGADELAIKQTWWQQITAPEIAVRFPGIKMINWFEWRKPEQEIDGATIDWTVTHSPRILEAFLSDFPRERFIFAGP